MFAGDVTGPFGDVPTVNPHPNKRTNYTPAEIRALSRLIFQAREMLQHNNQTDMLLDKSFWVQIANHMHASGWPKRSWVRLREKGRRLLMSTGSSAQHNTPASMCEPPTQPDTTPTTRCKSDPEAGCLAQSISTQIVTTSNIPSNSNGEIQVVSRSIQYSLPLLTPSTEVPSGPLTDTNTTPRIHVSPVPIPLPSPQILHVCSRATHAAANVSEARTISTGAPDRASPTNALQGAQNSTLSHNPPIIVQPSGASVSTASEVNRIDLSVSSDEDVEAATTDVGANKVQSPLMIDAVDGKLKSKRSRLGTGIARTESHLRKLVYEKKLEVLELKKRYWTEKLRVLFRQTHSPLHMESDN
ncbi:unnamed protein product [Dicrocoelium dendriticum]|nr:unnamed protein product [Dicrocoelium dendriticum]